MTDHQQENVRHRFKSFRKLLGLKQVDFANTANIKQSQVSEIESGRRNITSSIIIALEDAYNLNRKWLLHGEGDMLLKKGEDNNFKDSPRFIVTEFEEPYGTTDIKDKLLKCYEKNLRSQDKNIQLLEEVSRLKDQIIEAEREIRALMSEEKNRKSTGTRVL